MSRSSDTEFQWIGDQPGEGSDTQAEADPADQRETVTYLLAVLVGLNIGLAVIAGGFATTNLQSLDADRTPELHELVHGTNPWVADTDGDGLSDTVEIGNATNPRRADTDADGAPDRVEISVLETDPTIVDTDGDGLSDGREWHLETNPRVVDTDSDGVTDGDEQTHGSNPTLADTDGDGLSDGEEIGRAIDPRVPDTDSDGLRDGPEIEFGSNPTVKDTDQDGVGDAREHALSTNPNRVDTDADGLSDHDELDYGTDPTTADTDDDGLRDVREVTGRTDPTTADSDSDDLLDGYEVTTLGTDPTRQDSDGDGLLDKPELTLGTDPLESDTDGDGLSDRREVHGQTDAADPDTDRDGLEDGRELNAVGTDPTNADTDGDGFADGIELAATGPVAAADPLRKDVFVEVDYMTGEQPSQAALDAVQSAFANAPVKNPDGTHGITLHIILDEELRQEAHTTPREVSMIARQNRTYSGAGYHYGVAIVDAEIHGEKVGGFAGRGLIAFEVFSLPGYTGHVFMHELGHSLGLTGEDYAGIDSRRVPCSRYRSAMNYNCPYTFMAYSAGQPFNDWRAIATRPFVPSTDQLTAAR